MAESQSLSPIEAIDAADAVYAVRTSSDPERAFKNTSLRKSFLFNDESRFKGSSGLVFQSQSGFGVMAKGTGDREGELLIATRGTVTAADWLSNINVGTSLSSFNKAAHRGFNQIFHSFEETLATRLNGYAPKHVHCVGHSLGGALAALIAEWVEQKKICDTHLYTFGSPRVGLQGFSRTLTTEVSDDKIFRVCHKTDVVPMVPVWPFVHSPNPGTPCFIHSPGDFPGSTYHDRRTYRDSLNRNASANVPAGWSDLKKNPPRPNFEKQIERWLESDSPLSLTGNTISMIESALSYVIRKLALAGLTASLSILQTVVSGAVNVVDGLAYLLAKGAALVGEVSSLIASLMRRVLSAMGKVVVKTQKLTQDFIRWVLESLGAAIIRMARLAVQLAHG